MESLANNELHIMRVAFYSNNFNIQICWAINILLITASLFNAQYYGRGLEEGVTFIFPSFKYLLETFHRVINV